MLLFVEPALHAKVRERLNRLIHVPFNFDSSGSHIVFADSEEDYSVQENERSKQALDPFQELASTGQ